jgi:membrane protein implicated in regulation of membrane protease activity
MDWWAWIAVGAILLGSELAFVDAQFGGLELAPWLQWLIFAVLAAVSTIVFRRRIYERMRRKLPAMKGGPAGEMLIMPTALPPGETCRLEYRGGSWSAINGGKAEIAAGAKARIERVDGLTLVVHGDG